MSNLVPINSNLAPSVGVDGTRKNGLPSPSSIGITPKKGPSRLKPVIGKFTPPSKSQTQGLKKTIKHEVFAHQIIGGLIVFSIIKSNGGCAFLNKMENASVELASDERIQLVQFANHVDGKGVILKAAPGNYYNFKVLVCAKTADEGDDIMVTMKIQGDAIAAEFQARTPPYINGKVTGKTNTATFAYCKNDEEEYLNKIVGDKSASEVVARMYGPYIADGSFEEQSDDIIATYFKDADAGEVAKMITFAHKKILKESQ